MYKDFQNFIKKAKNKIKYQYNRRQFLKTSGIAMLGFSLPFRVYPCPEPIPPLEGESLVSLVKKDTIKEMVAKAIELAGGLEEIQPDDTVLIKPNITFKKNSSFDDIRVVTNPDVLRAVIQSIKERTSPENITVADACAFGYSTKLAAESYGLYDVCLEEEVHFLGLEEEKYISFSHKDFVYIKGRRKIPSSLSSFDHFINVPILKNHEMVPFSNAQFTCCLKNFVGILEPMNRLDIHTMNLGEKVAELNLCVPNITMNIVDALTIILTNGPAGNGMKVAHTGFVLASKDLVACDSLALAVLKHYASEQGVKKDYVNQPIWEQAQIKRAAQLGLGRANPEQIIIADDGIDNIGAILEKWS